MASTRIEDCRRASHSRDEERHVELWTKLIPAALEDGSKESEEAVAEVAMLELHRISSSQTLQLASRGVLQAALKSSPGFQRAFATAVVKTAASRTGMPPNALLILVRWTCLLLLALDGASGAKALARLVEVQDQLLRQLATTKRGQGRLKAAVRVASQALRQDAARLLPAYEQALRASGSGLLASVLVASEREREAVSRATLEAFCGDKALGAREGLNEVALAAWRPVAAAWPAEVVAAALAPAIDRAAKRNPELGLRALDAALAGAARRADRGSAAAALLQGLAALLVSGARHAKDSVRAAALAAATTAGGAVPAGAAGRVAVARGAFDLLAGRGPEGRLKNLAERVSLARVAAALAPVPARDPAALAARAGASAGVDVGGEVAAGALAELLEAGCEAWAKEPHEDAKAALIAAVAAWAAELPADLPACLVARLAESAGDVKEAPRRAALLALTRVAATPALAAQLAPKLAAPLAKAVAEGAAKAALRQDGALAGLALARMQLASEEGACAASLVQAASTALCVPGAVSRFAAPAAAAAAQLALLVLASEGGLVPAASDELYKSVALALLHRSPEVSRAAALAVRAAVSRGPDAASAALSAGVLAALQHWSDNLEDANLIAAAEAPKENEAEAAPDQARRARFLAAIRAAVPVLSSVPVDVESAEEATALARRCGALVSPAALASLALVAHGRPLEPAGGGKPRAGEREARTWRALLGSQASPLRALLRAAAEAVGDKALRIVLDAFVSGRAPQPEASVGAVRAIVALAPARLLPAALRALQPALRPAAHDALTPLQVRTYFTPAGRLASESAEGGIMPAEVLERALASSETGGVEPRPLVSLTEFLRAPEADGAPSGAVSAPDSGAAKPKPANAKAGPGAAKAKGPAGKAAGASGAKSIGASTASDARRRQLESEERERRSVHGVVFTLSRALLALAAAARADPATTLAQIEALAAPVVPLLASPLVGREGAAWEAAVALAEALPAGLDRHAGDVAAAIRMVAEVETKAAGSKDESTTLPAAYQPLLERRAFCAALAALHAAVGGVLGDEEREPFAGDAPLPAPAVRFAFPLLRATLAAPGVSPWHVPALDLLDLHLDALPASATLRLLHGALETLPAQAPRIGGLLRRLCAAGLDDPVDLEAALAGLRASRPGTRLAALEGLSALPALASGALARDGRALCALWVARCDPDERVAARGVALWDLAAAPAPTELGDLVPVLVTTLAEVYLPAPEPDVRAAGAAALAAALVGAPAGDESASQLALDACVSVFTAGTKSASAESAQLGAAAGLEAIAAQLSLDQATGPALAFVVGRGLVCASGDARDAFIRAGAAVVDAHGARGADRALPLFEAALADPGAGAGRKLAEQDRDHVRQGVIVLLGTLARHLPAESGKVRDIVASLLGALDTPSEAVQRRSAGCLPPLVQHLSGDRAYVEGMAKDLLKKCLGARQYAERRGAAFGLAGVVKGLGIGCLKALGIMDELRTAVGGADGADSKNIPVSRREGALMAYERLSAHLGRLFEPYVTSVLPSLLAALGDNNGAVREAAGVAAEEIMRNLSAQGVRLVLPALLGGLDEVAPWRTKQGSIQLLAATSHLNPRQLGAALPTVVPRLAAAMGDAHPRVAAAADEALRQVSRVIRSPEVARLVPDLLKALADPAKHTRRALDLLLSTVFVNTVDAAALALIMPVIRRGLRERSGDAKKRSARIVGSLCGLANDPADMAPYVAELLPHLRAALIDPLPEVRATAARALGALVRGMRDARGSEDLFADLVPELAAGLRAETSAVERSGAAQGLAEVLAVRGPAALAALLPRVLEGARAASPAAREGAITLLKYVPGCMPEAYSAHLAATLPCILRGLADEAEGVRDAALAAARVCVDLYAASALDLLLPTVEAGTRNASWRIRQSSIELLGDLLFKLAGASGKVQQDLHNAEAEGIGNEAHAEAILAAVGRERRAEVLAALYMARSDEAAGVRAAALHVWKTLVSNTPKALGEIAPQLTARVVAALADAAEDSRAAAGRCLGELVRKMGDRVLQEVVPILQQGMQDPRPHIRQGVCNGLRDVLDNAGRDQLRHHLPKLLPAVQLALCDPNPEVRLAAGGVFAALTRGGGGGGVMEGILPPLLARLEGPVEGQAAALEGLRVALGVRPALLGGMLPKLLRPPATPAKLKALGALCEAAGPALHAHLGTVVPALLALARDHPDVSPAAAAAHDTLRGVALAVKEDGLYALVAELLRGLEDGARRRGAAVAIAALFRGAGRADPEEHVPSLVAALVPCLVVDADDADAMDDAAACLDALAAVLGSIPKELQPNHVRTLRDAVLAARDKERRRRRERGLALTPLLIAGFSLPKAMGPLLPIYLQGILQGSAELREVAAEALGQLVEVVSEETLRPYVIQSTGPLIRIIGDRFPWQVKAAILRTLGTLIQRAGAGLKPFVPQLQTTFVKSLLDAEPRVCALAAENLGALSALSPRLDALLLDLAASARAAPPPAGAVPYLAALESCLHGSGARASPEALAKVGAALQEAAARAGDEPLARAAGAGALGALCACVPAGEARALLAGVQALGAAPPGASDRLGDRLGAALAAAAAARHAPDLLRARAPDDERAAIVAGLVAAAVQRFARDPHYPIRQAAARLAARIVMAQLQDADESDASNTSDASSSPPPTALPRLAPLFVSLLGSDQDSDVQATAVAALRKLAGSHPSAPQALAPHLADLVPSLLAVISDAIGSTRLNAERTLARVLGVAGGDEGPARDWLASGAASPAVARQLTDTYLRRLAKLPPGEEEDFEAI